MACLQVAWIELPHPLDTVFDTGVSTLRNFPLELQLEVSERLERRQLPSLIGVPPRISSDPATVNLPPCALPDLAECPVSPGFAIEEEEPPGCFLFRCQLVHASRLWRLSASGGPENQDQGYGARQDTSAHEGAAG